MVVADQCVREGVAGGRCLTGWGHEIYALRMYLKVVEKECVKFLSG